MGSNTAASFSEEDIRVLDHRQKMLIVQEGNKSPMYLNFKKTGQVVNCYDNVEQPMYLGSGTDGRWIGRGDRLPEGGERQIAMSVWNNRYLVVPSSEDDIDNWENDGNPQSLYDLKELSQWEASLAWHRAMSYAIWHGAGGKQPDGILNFLEKLAPASQVKTFGGISKNTYGDWWYNQYVQLTQNFGAISPGTNQTAGELAFSQLIDQCTIGTKLPSDVWTTKAIWKNFKRLFRERYSGGHHMVTKQLDGVDVPRVRGFMVEGCEINWDPNITADTIVALHVKDKYDASRVSEADKEKIFGDMEAIGVKKPLELNGNLFAIINPNVRSRPIAPRSPFRQLHTTKWIADSFNIGAKRLSDNGIAGSDNGSRWSTW